MHSIYPFLQSLTHFPRIHQDERHRSLMVSLKGVDLARANALTKRLARATPVIRRSGKSKVDPRVPLPRVDVVSESLCGKSRLSSNERSG